MKIKLSKQLWVLIALTVVVLFLVLSIHTRYHFDYTSGRVRTSQRIAWFTYDSQTEDTWLTVYAPEDTTPVWLSMHVVTPIFSAAINSDGARLHNDLNYFKDMLDEMNADEKAELLLVESFFHSLNQTTPSVDAVHLTLDRFQCLHRDFPVPPYKQPVAFEKLQALINKCFSTPPE